MENSFHRIAPSSQKLQYHNVIPISTGKYRDFSLKKQEIKNSPKTNYRDNAGISGFGLGIPPEEDKFGLLAGQFFIFLVHFWKMFWGKRLILNQYPIFWG
jgi:hypothetical protein